MAATLSSRRSRLRQLLRPMFSVVAGLAATAAIIQAAGYPVGAAYAALWTGATGLAAGPARYSTDLPLGANHLELYQLARTLAQTTPLMLTGLAVAVGLRAGLFNIGAQGQMTAASLAVGVVGLWDPRSGGPPAWILVPLLFCVAAVVGGAWGALAGMLKAYRGVHEVISTIMLNYIAVDCATYLVTHDLKDPRSMAPETAALPASARLAPLVSGSNLTGAIVLALAAAAVVTFVIGRTRFGFRLRATGLSPDAAAAAGISLPGMTVWVMTISGALAGLAGAVGVMGVDYRYVQGGVGTYGFDGISVALLGGLSGPGVALGALFFGALQSGASYMQIQSNVPASISVVVEAMVILFVGARYFPLPAAWRKRLAPAPSDAEEPADAVSGL